jgi:hypothetical protein
LVALAIDEGFIARLVVEAINYPSLTPYLREAKLATSKPEVTLSEPIYEYIMIATMWPCSPEMNNHLRHLANFRDSLTYQEPDLITV